MKRIAVICLAVVLILIPLTGMNCDCNSGSGWKVYHNKEHDFRFDYPEDWDVKEGNISGGVVAVGPDLGTIAQNVLVTIEPASGMSLDEYIAVTGDTTINSIPDAIVVKENYVYVNEMIGYEWVVKYTQYYIDVQQKLVIFLANDKVYGITFSGLQSTYDEFSDIFDNILDSFVIGS